MKTSRALFALALLAACGEPPPVKTPTTPKTPPQAAAAPTEDAKAFVERVNRELLKIWIDDQRAQWIKDTYITDDTETNAARTQEAVMAYTAKAIKEATRYDGQKLDPDTERQIHLLKVSQALPAPNDPAKREELANLQAKMSGIYGKGKVCDLPDGIVPKVKGNDEKCHDLVELTKLLATDRDYDHQLAIWKGWHAIAQPMRPMFKRYAELGNEGAREIGFKDLGELWKAGYDMTPDEFEKETDRLWSQLRPMYEQLHCYVRGKLSAKYGADKVPAEGPIPAHLLGNMWAQDWSNIYPLVEPYKGEADIDVTAALKEKYCGKGMCKNPDDFKSSKEMVKLGEAFFVSLGLDPLPQTFWERSLFDKPKDRDVECHASAWDVGYNNDLRIKMCVQPTEEDLITIHHELGHDYYYHSYYKLPTLYQGGANDGFHEGIGDTLALSVTPGYLKQLGLLKKVSTTEKSLINLQMKDALEKIAFIPFGLLVDRWRWDVFAGKIPDSRYSAGWWELRKKYQGVDSPVARSESEFDPGAKYHVPANVPYTRYFLARVLQFQFHRALCKTVGHTGPLHECSIYGNKEAGARLRAMLDLGASKPWPEALKAISGESQMDATAIMDYFAPLTAWLQKENAGKKCGW